MELWLLNLQFVILLEFRFTFGSADRLAKLVPNMTKLNKIFGVEEKILRQKFRAEDMELINQLLNISEGDGLEAEIVNQAKVLEGS